MSLPDPPNAYPTPFDTTGRYPGSTTVPGRTIQQGFLWGHIPVFGRNGQQADATLTSWVRETLDENSSQTDWWTRADPTSWMTWFDSDTMAGLRFKGVCIEFRSAAEVEAAGSGSVPVVFAVSGWDGTPGFPPLDGVDDQGYTYGSGWNNMKFFRVLVRDDLASGGAGARYSGRAFLLETIMHEFGHAAVAILSELYGDSYVQEQICALFEKPLSQWNDQTIPWAQRVSEAAAEFYKDVVFPKRRYNSRAAYELKSSHFADWCELYFDLLYVPLWRAANTGFYFNSKEDQFFNNIGACSRTLQNAIVQFQFRPSGSDYFNIAGGQIFQWPPDGIMRMHWAFDPRPISDPGFGYWEADDSSGLIFVDGPPQGEPNGYTNPRLAASFYDIGANLNNLQDPSRIHYGSTVAEIWSMGSGPTPPNGGEPVPPSSGVYVIDPTPFLSAVPAEGCNVFVSTAEITLPKYDLPGQDYVWPWFDYSLRRPRPNRIQPPYPYHATSFTLGEVVTGRITLPHRIRGRTLRPSGI